MDNYECLISHQVDLDDGGFKKFEAGKIYSRNEIPGEVTPGLFKPYIENEEV